MICFSQGQLMWTTKLFKVDVMSLLLVRDVKINFSLGFDNTDYQTNKLQNLNALHCTLVLYVVPKVPELSQLEDIKERGPHRKVKWWLTYKHVTEVVRNICVNHQAKRVDSKAILHLIKTFICTLIIWINKQTNTNIAY